MKIIEARNVNHALAQGIRYLLCDGVREESRNGRVLVAPGPVITEYANPCQRVVFSPLRDANPFFHLMESLWMLCGRNDLAFPLYFNKRFANYSDDGVTCHGAYGHRWRAWFGFDQLSRIAHELTTRPNSRRAVLTMWSPAGDLISVTDREGVRYGGMESKDVPCNTQAYFDIRFGKLNMTVCNRSNDVIWGAYGANAVHFSVLQEYLAAWVGVEVGMYRQFSNNFHAYLDVYDEAKLSAMASEAATTDYYVGQPDGGLFPQPTPTVRSYPLVDAPTGGGAVQSWIEDLVEFMAAPDRPAAFHHSFFRGVAQPMYMAWKTRKEKRGNGLSFIEDIKAEDWRLACTLWAARREKGAH